MEEKVKEHRPQDDIPEEVIIHYIVKDYRRMYFQEEDYLKRISIHKQTIKNQREKIRRLFHELRQRQVEALTDDKLREMIQRLIKKADEYDALKEENEKLLAQIEDVKASRRAVVKSVNDDLEEQLKEANQRIKLLAQAIVDPEKSAGAFLEQCTVRTIETGDEKQWMAGAAEQLKKAANKLITVDEKIAEFDIILKDLNNNEEVSRMRKVFNRLAVKLDGALNHIECFMDKVGEIKV